MQYWLVKSEASCYSIDDFAIDSNKLKKVPWTGIRNYQARNYMRDLMKVGDFVLFYHSMGEPTGVYGIAKVVSEAHPDLTAFDTNDEHFDPKSSKDKPTWFCVDLGFIEKFKTPVSLSDIKRRTDLKDMMVAKKGSRLSVQPVSKAHFEVIQKLARTM